MADLYKCAGVTKQGFSKWENYKSTKEKTESKDVLSLAKQVRKSYLPGAGPRPLYDFIRSKPELDTQLIGWGKHSFENLCHAKGMRCKTTRYIPKTTVHGAYRFDNMIEGLFIYDINKILVSDICYLFGAQGKLLGYATSVIDLYSRLLLGLVFSQTMKAIDTVIPAIEQALSYRKLEIYQGAYFHSDQGKQYIAKIFISRLREKGIESSMSRSCYENPFAESFNNTLKNHMLNEYDFYKFTELKRKEKFIKYVYNNNKTHSSLKRRTPVEFELELQSIEIDKRVGLEIKMIE